MKRLKWNRKFSILVLIMFITVTFASFNTNLFIDGNAYVRVDRDIRITNIHLLETEYNGYENTNSEYTNRTISTDVSLPLQASSVTYEITISNVSDKRYKITDILEESYDNPDVKYEILDASIGNIVEPHTEKTFRVRFTNRVTIVEEEDVYRTFTYNFIYTGDEQTFVVPFTGEYTLEVWGAQGGNTGEARGGFGGYSTGKINLTKGQTLYVNVGGAGASSTTRPAKLEGGYNGGGTGYQNSHYTETFGSGGGATHIATTSGELYKLNNFRDNIIIVAGGGGGAGGNEAGTRVENGGSGGGKVGNKGASTNSDNRCSGGSQTDGGAAGHEGLAGSFGKGASYNNTTSLGVNSRKGGGGGGGYYGGGSNGWTSSGSCGGSGYIGNTNLTDKAMYCFNCTEASDEDIKSIKVEEHYETPTSQCAKDGNGFAKITITRKVVDGSEFDYSFMNAEQTFVAPYSGSYKLETWGAQGGSYNTTYAGGYGGYSVGSIDLNKDDQLYINVGGAGGFYPSDQVVYDGGYNGGGSCRASVNVDVNVGCGGGATHIATASGLLSTLENNKDSVLIVSGGGGGAIYYYNSSNARYTCPGGSGGGYIGNSANLNVIASAYTLTGAATGGTQSSGGIGMQSTFNGTTDDKTEDGSFGKGGGYIGVVRETGGGGGWYGGASGSRSSAAGGSGYIGNTNLTDKKMYCFNCETSNAVSTRTQTTSTHSLVPKKNIAKEGNGYSKITLLKRTVNQTKLTLDFTFEEYVNGNEYLFGYTGSEQVFNVPKTGIYKLEVWGAQGKTNDYCSSNNCIGGYGGYSVGNVKLYKGTTLYLTVGEYGRNKKQAFGGGGYADLGGGGASHIAYKSGTLASLENSLDDILIVAGGGGGNDTSNSINPSGGGFRGTNGFYSSEVLGGWQEQHSTTNDYSGLFGQGGTAAYVDRETYLDYGGAGGGGFYGGDGSPGGSGSGGGGSGYIANPSLSDKSMYCYNCTESSADSTKTISTENHSVDPISNYAKEENGYAKITCIEETTDYIFDYTGDVQEFVAPYKGIYKVELWGAQGGDNTSSKIGGKGGYTSGNVSLSKGTKLYVYVGEHKTIRNNPSFNGALNSTNDGASAGGATDVRLVSSENWYDFDSLKTRIMVAGGGGATSDSASYPGGDAGGLVGYRTIGSSGQCSYPGTQISPGTENCWGNYQPGNFSNGSFGLGSRYGASGGSGWFGGAGGYNKYGGGSGGSSFISGHPGCVSITENSTEDNISFVNDSNGIACNDENSVSYNSVGYNMDSACNKHYSGKVFTDTVMIDGQGYAWDGNGKGNSIVGMPSPDGRTTIVGNTGNGYARITLIEKRDNYNITYDLDGGTLKNSKNTYSEFDDDITLGTPTKEGHTFLGWTGGKNLAIDKEDFWYSGPDKIFKSSTSGYAKIATVKPNTTYTISKKYKGNRFTVITSEVPITAGATFSRALTQGDLDIKTYTFTTTANEHYVFFGYYNSGDTSSSLEESGAEIQIEEGNVATDYEAPIINRTKNLIIPSGSTGNRTYTAFWRDDSLLCRKATTLHSTTCSWAYEDTKACNGAGYATGDPITYGTLVDGNIKAGDAFDCDVNGDGIFDSVNERFYYLIDLEGNSNYAVLLYSNLVKNGVKTNSFSYIEWGIENANNLGPTVAMGDLPTTSQWGNVSLSSTSRQLVSDDNTLVTTAGDNAILDYSGKSARLPTYKEIRTACGVHSSKLNEYCEYVLEGTSYDLGVGSSNYGIWLETPMSVESTKVYEIDTHWRSIGNNYTTISKHFMVKPVIEVPKSKLRY